jgi:hypothetical protein
MKTLPLSIVVCILMACPAVGADRTGDTAPGGLAGKLHVVPTPIRSYRLLMMTMDDDGWVWTGAIHRVFHRYDPRTGVVRTIRLPYDATACACLCLGEKVYILGQTYPRLIVYNRKTETFREAGYPSPRPDVWYGSVAPDRRHLYLYDRGSVGVIKWDSQTETGKPIPSPYKAPPPASGRIETRDNALWCHLWSPDILYRPIGIARMDLATDTFTGFYPFPEDDAGLEPYDRPETTFFLPYSLKGKVVPFDFKARRWCKFLEVPRYGEVFGFLGGPTVHQGRNYFSMSTYNGTKLGCDQKPFHFCNAILEFDPQSRRFEILTLKAEGAYHQIAYTLSARGEFFATGTNIREPDGTLNAERAGEVVFWQTRRPEKP